MQREREREKEREVERERERERNKEEGREGTKYPNTSLAKLWPNEQKILLKRDRAKSFCCFPEKDSPHFCNQVN